MKTGIFLSFVAIITLLTFSCEKYEDGYPGRAYLSISWSNDEPDYIETGNSSFPQSFYYEDYYRSMPGFYTLYYEGYVWNGSSTAKYAWEVDYEIWINPGETAQHDRNGFDGADTYFNIDLSPYGPYTSVSKSLENLINHHVTQLENGDYQIIEKRNEYNLKITYKNATLNGLSR